MLTTSHLKINDKVTSRLLSQSKEKSKTYSDPHFSSVEGVLLALQRSLLVRQWESIKTCQ